MKVFFNYSVNSMYYIRMFLSGFILWLIKDVSIEY